MAVLPHPPSPTVEFGGGGGPNAAVGMRRVGVLKVKDGL